MKRRDRLPDSRQSRLIAKVAEAPATYYGAQPDEKHRRMAVVLLRRVLREASTHQPNVDTLVG